MAKITYALLLSDTLKLKNLQVTQVEATIDVTGAYDDSSSLQRLRDAVVQSFQDRRRNLNAYLQEQDEAIERAKVKKTKLALTEQTNVEMRKRVAEFERALQTRVAAWIKEQQEEAREQRAETTKFWVKCSWSVYKVAKAVLEFEEPGGGAEMLKAVKALYDTGKEVIGLIGDLRQYFKGEATIRAEIEKSRKAIKAAKGQPTESLVGKLEMQLKAYGPKISGIEASARSLASQLDRLLDQAEKGGKALAADCEPAIDKTIQQVIEINEGVNKARDFQKRSLDALRTAQKTAVKDPSSWLDYFKWFDGAYEKVNDYFEEKTIDSMEGAVERMMDQVIKKYTD